MAAMTRGPLPPGTYWRRRLFVSLLAVGIVFVAATALGAGGDAADEGNGDGATTARHAGAVSPTDAPSAVGPSATASSGSSKGADTKGTKGQVAGKATKLAAPSGRCATGDLTVTPTTKRAVAGQPIELTLALQTRTDPACHWTVGARSLVVQVSNDAGEVWSTRHCGEVLTSEPVVVRRAVPTEVSVTWDARRSDDGCPKDTEWVLPGEYDVTAAALGGEPTQQSMRLYAPGEMPTEDELRAEVRSGNALERLQRRQADEDQG